jgi:serine/threonine protein kinase
MSTQPAAASSIVCPDCGASNAFGLPSCASCGASLVAAMRAAETGEVANLETDPDVVETWHRLRDATLGEYDIYAPIGRGGMATVFLALDLALEREVALKVISPSIAQTPSMVERFRREARTAASLSHPNIIPVHQVRDADGLLFFVMKYVNGPSLESVIRSGGPLSLDVARSIITQAGSALHFAHRKGVVHRDVKPANILLDQDGWTIVTDFGIAKVADTGPLTSAGLVVGTPTYMSPEQFTDQAVTGASDQYSLGVVAYQMLTGRTPFQATKMADIMRAHLLDPPGDPRILRPELPDSLAAIVMRMLAKAPEERWATVGDAVSALEALPRRHDEETRSAIISIAKSSSRERPRISIPISPIPTGRRTQARIASDRARRRRRRWIVGGSTVAVAAIAGVLGARLLLKSHAAPAPVRPQTLGAPAQGRTTVEIPKTPAASLPAPTDAKPHTMPSERQTAPRERPASAKDAKPPVGSRGAARPTVTPAESATAMQKPESSATTPPLPVAAAPPVEGAVELGTRIPKSVLFVSGVAQTLLFEGLHTFRFRPGRLHIGIHAEGCSPWDTTLDIPAGDTLRVGFRNPSNCKQP